MNVPAGDRDVVVDPTSHRANCGLGAVVDLEGEASHDVLADGLELLANLEHRGTTGADSDTGDGAGVVLERPDEFFRAVVDAELPDRYGVGVAFLPTDDRARAAVRDRVETVCGEYDLEVLAWRTVPTDGDALGREARETEPAIAQWFVAPTDDPGVEALDRRLYVARRAVASAVEDVDGAEEFYVASLDRQTVVYKGLLTGPQLRAYYPDLRDERVRSTFVMVHARFSTNTLGAWHLAHPYRRVVHNGEFNTLQGNVNWMRAREPELGGGAFGSTEGEFGATEGETGDGFGGERSTVLPVIEDTDASDTAVVDNVLEFLLAGGVSLPRALRTMIPEAWRDDVEMSSARRDWYDYHASVMEPWDGPALVVATDGDRVGAVLDRNGLRPCRYDVTDDRVVLASEVGALDHDPTEVRRRGRLEPGELFLADPDSGEVLDDEDVFADLADGKYGEWVDREQRRLPHPGAEAGDALVPESVADLRAHQATHGYTHDELETMLEPMATDGADPVGSMGDDTPLTPLADADRGLPSYFRQRFAQVTNPAIDHVREAAITSLESRLGPRGDPLVESPDHARQVVLASPVLPTPTYDRLRSGETGLETTVVDATFDPDRDLSAAVAALRERAAEAVRSGTEVLVLSDRETGPDRAPVPALLATGAVHHHLVREGLRGKTGLVVDAGAPRTVHQVATLVGYGAGAVHPYLAYETVADAVAGPDGPTPGEAVARYVEAVEDGLRTTTAKMGISTFQSYQGAQVFETVGLAESVVAEYFPGTPTRTGGVDLASVERDLLARHDAGFDDPEIERRGEFEYRTDGVHHGWNPTTVSRLQAAVQGGDFGDYREFAAAADGETTTLRSLLEFADRESVPPSAVEPVESIVERFSTAAMSLGSLSPEAHETNAVAANRLGAKANTGEGGEPPERFGTERECPVKQVASGRFGVTSAYLAAADELQIKIAQGSKPGEGGHLPGRKVNELIADVRCTVPGVDLISPPPQHDIYSIEDLKQLIYDLKAANPAADVNVKLVAEAGIGPIAAGVAQAGADAVHVSGHSGGTGASPRTSIKSAGVPWELGLVEANRVLHETGLRDRVRLSVDGGLRTGRDVAVAALLGAEEFVFGTASLVSSGCVMARICHTNDCPTGVATQRPELRERFSGQPDYAIDYLSYVARELRELMAELGFETVDEMVGEVDALRPREDLPDPRARSLDLSELLAEPPGEDVVGRKVEAVPREPHFDRELLPELDLDAGEDALERTVTNGDRAVGTLLSSRVSSVHGVDGLPGDSLRVGLRGTAGQSLGAFLAPGVTLELVGSANDYVGKGLSGGRIVARRPDGVDRTEDVRVGNVTLYGATDGELFVEGAAGERFAVRNSGARAVVEGVGDHGCEYMTGGVVVVLGETGTNFAAGMSGGVAYVHDPEGRLGPRVNREMVTTTRDLSTADRQVVRHLLERHRERTGSDRAEAVLADWTPGEFVRVLPEPYREAVAEHPEADVRRRLVEGPLGEEGTDGEGSVADGD